MIQSTFRSRISGMAGLLAILAPVAALILVAPPHELIAQQPQFEADSVKLHPMAPGAYRIRNYTHAPPFVIPAGSRFADTAYVQDLVMEAYGVNEYQIRYLPAWTRSREGLLYDVEAIAKANATPSAEQFQQMLQALLADRFHLKTHWETKAKVSVYALTVDKNGPKFKAFSGDVAAHEPADGGSSPLAGTTIFALARFLTQNLDEPVLDRTGLPAVAYDFDIDKLVDYHEVDREQEADPQEAQDYLMSSVHQLGLKLESRKETMQLLIIDHVDEPSVEK